MVEKFTHEWVGKASWGRVGGGQIQKWEWGGGGGNPFQSNFGATKDT